MAFLRITRDKRGYEHFYLIQPTTRRGKNPRLLYWFRTPPHLKMGREPFDAEARRAIELGNPDIAFDWKAIGDTPVPPVVEPEKWRERRRLERVSRQSQPSEDHPDAPSADTTAATEEAPGFASGEDAPLRVRATDLDPATIPEPSNLAQPPVERRAGGERAGLTTTSAPAASNTPESDPEAAPARKGRRRRRRRRGGRSRPDGASPLGREQAPGQGAGSGDPAEFAVTGADGGDADDMEGEATDEEPVSLEESKLPDPDEP